MRRSASIAIACAAGAAAVLPAASPASATTTGFGLVIPLLAPMLPGQSGWVSTMWAATGDVCDVRVTASGSGLTVKYPANTASYSSLSKSNTLGSGKIDYAAFHVNVPTSKPVSLTPLTLSYTYTEKTGGASTCTGTKRTETRTATLPIVSVSGAAITQKTTSVTVPRKTPVWTQLVFHARKGGVEDLRISVSGGPAGLVVTYPAQRAYTQLNGEASLPIGVDDFTAVRFDATNVAVGTYKLTVKQTYGSTTDTNDLTLVVV